MNNEKKDVPAIDPRLLNALYGSYEEDEIDLLAYWKVLWGKRKFIAGISIVAAVFAVGISLLMPNIYRAEVLLSPVEEESSGKGGLSSMLGGLGGIASLAGVSVGSEGSVEEHLAVLKSRQFIWAFVKEENLMPVLFEDDWDEEAKRWKSLGEEDQPSLWDAWRLLVKDGLIAASIEKESGLVRLTVDWQDPVLAAEWAAKLVERLNEYLRMQAIRESNKKLKYLEMELAKTQLEENRRALFELISTQQKQAMLANTQQDFVFKTIDEAVVPDKKIKPKRVLIAFLTIFVAGFMCVIWVLAQEGLRKRNEGLGKVEYE